MLTLSALIIAWGRWLVRGEGARWGRVGRCDESWIGCVLSVSRASVGVPADQPKRGCRNALRLSEQASGYEPESAKRGSGRDASRNSPGQADAVGHRWRSLTTGTRARSRGKTERDPSRERRGRAGSGSRSQRAAHRSDDPGRGRDGRDICASSPVGREPTPTRIAAGSE